MTGLAVIATRQVYAHGTFLFDHQMRLWMTEQHRIRAVTTAKPVV